MDVYLLEDFAFVFSIMLAGECFARTPLQTGGSDKRT
jgi:hypothetical protein